MEAELSSLSMQVGEMLRSRGFMLAVAESCTGGWVAKVVTDIAGSSAWFERGFVTYTNEAKREMLGVDGETLAAHGAVSEPTAEAMARGALRHSRAQLSLAISGVAGPGGGSLDKPVGTVCLAWAQSGGGSRVCTAHFAGDRDAVRRQAVAAALEGLLGFVRERE